MESATISFVSVIFWRLMTRQWFIPAICQNDCHDFLLKYFDQSSGSGCDVSAFCGFSFQKWGRPSSFLYKTLKYAVCWIVMQRIKTHPEISSKLLIKPKLFWLNYIFQILFKTFKIILAPTIYFRMILVQTLSFRMSANYITKYIFQNNFG